jgi:hypothetical protein
MAWVVRNGQTLRLEPRFEGRGALLMKVALDARQLEMADARQRAGGERRGD